MKYDGHDDGSMVRTGALSAEKIMASLVWFCKFLPYHVISF
jgi:hypothetical protein